MLPATTLNRRPRTQGRLLLLSLPFRGLGEGLARLAVPTAVVLSGVALGTFSHLGAAETFYLTALAGVLLAAVALLAPRPAWEVSTGGVLAGLALWVMPAGPTRGSALSLLLTACLAIAAARGLRRVRDTPPVALLAALSVGLQVLLRGERLLAVDTRDLVALLILPVVGAFALAVLSRRHGLFRVLVAGAAALALAPGWTTASTLTFVALAAGELLRDPRLVEPPSISLAPRLLRPAALLALAAIVLREPGQGGVLAAAALSLAFFEPAARGPRRWLPVAPAVLALAGTAIGSAQPWTETLSELWWLPLLLPGGFAVEQRRLPGLLAALALLPATARGAAADLGGSAVAAAVALAALSLPDGGSAARPWRARVARLQGLWSAALLGLTALAAAYPWLRPQPLEEAAATLGLAPSWPSALLLPAALAILAVLVGLVPPGLRVSGARPAVGVGAAAVLLLLAVQLPPGPLAVAHPAGSVRLDPNEPRWRMGLPGKPVGTLVLDTSLSFAAALPPGTPVATVSLEGRRGNRLLWTLRAGEDTGEWAAERPDVASRPDFRAPEPWLLEVVPGRFFAHRYRTYLPLAEAQSVPVPPEEPLRITVTRRPDLPPEVTLALFHIEARP